MSTPGHYCRFGEVVATSAVSYNRISNDTPTLPARIGQADEEPVAWYAPIVTNTQAELRQAIAELRSGTFIK